MNDQKSEFTLRHHTFKQRVLALLQPNDFSESSKELHKLPTRKVINSLFPFISYPDQVIKWHAVTVLGALVAQLAEKNIDAGREIVRRLMWSINEESGSCGWGAPEAMGEIMACHEGLANEYAPLLRSYISKTGNCLDPPLLQRGVVWGLGRLAQERPDCVQVALDDLSVFLVSSDALLRGLAVWALEFLDCASIQNLIKTLLNDHTDIDLYVNEKIMTVSICDLAQQALARL
jgi:HEAT-like repeat